MDKIVLALTVHILFNAITTNGLSCDTGYNIKSDFLKDYQIVTKQCQTDTERCLRIEANAMFVVPLTIVYGACVSTERCNEDCNLLFEGASPDAFGFGQSLSVTECSRICCNTDHCNSNSVQSIQQNQRPISRPTHLSATSPASVGSRTCYSGISNGSTGKNSLTLSTLCPSSETHCLRQEVVTMATSGALGMQYVIGLCANETTCAESCDSLALEIIGDSTLLAKSCKMACCDFVNCNALSIDVLNVVSGEITENLRTSAALQTTSVDGSQFMSTMAQLPSSASTNHATTLVLPIAQEQTTSISTESLSTSFPTTSPPLTNPPTTSTLSTSSRTISTRSLTTTSSPTTRIFKNDPVYTTAKTTSQQQTSRASTFIASSARQEVSDVPTRHCRVGYQVDHLRATSWNLHRCPSVETNSCLRQEFIVELAAGLSVNVISGTCANQSNCLGMCKEGVHLLVQQGIFAGSLLDGINLSDLPITSCSMSCCSEDNCNEGVITNNNTNPIKEIRAIRPSFPTETETITGNSNQFGTNKVLTFSLTFFTWTLCYL